MVLYVTALMVLVLSLFAVLLDDYSEDANLLQVPSKVTAFHEDSPLKQTIQSPHLMALPSHFGLPLMTDVQPTPAVEAEQGIPDHVSGLSPLAPTESQPVSNLLPEASGLPTSVQVTATIFLTFDDGPNQETKKILDLLDQYGQKATFFVLKGGMDKYPELILRMVKSGHRVGLHGISHSKEIFYATPDSALWEIDTSNAALEAITGQRTTLVRTPFGSYPRLTRAHYERLTSAGYSIWDWNVDTQDSIAGMEDAMAVFDRAVSGIEKLKNRRAIVLMHDKPHTVQALESLLPYMKLRGIQSAALPDGPGIHQTIVEPAAQPLVEPETPLAPEPTEAPVPIEVPVAPELPDIPESPEAPEASVSSEAPVSPEIPPVEQEGDESTDPTP
jgi:peptidoglycan/xylan/chitin deacetylase (PgdA/CDA1 family)